MTATKPESTSATYRRCAAAVEKAIKAIQANPSLYRGRTARNKLVELAAAAKQLDRLLDGKEGDDEDHFGEAFAAAGLDMKAADVDALAACAAAADDDAETPVTAAGDVEPTPAALAPAASRPLDADARRRTKLKQKKKKWKERKKAQREAAAEAELPPCREIDTPPEVLAALEAADRAATPEPTVPADPSLFKPGGASSPKSITAAVAASTASKTSWGRGFLASGTVKKEPDLRDPFAYIASTIDEDDLTAPALHDAPSPNFDGLVIEEVTPEELARLAADDSSLGARGAA